MMKLIMAFYEKSLEILGSEIKVESIISLPVKEKIGRFKYIPEEQVEEKYNEIKSELVSQLKELAERGE